MSTIITRNSATSGSVPSSLVQGELAINVTDNRLFFGSGSGNIVKEFGVTASYALMAESASYAVSASYEINYETSSSYADFAVSASYALSSSYAITASYASQSSYSNRTTQIDVYVKNQSGAPIPKGTVVRITGSNNSSDIPRIVTASYENDNNSANTLGITTTAIANGSEGYVITEGVLLGIDTTNFDSGQLIYLGLTGSIIGYAPIAPLHAVRLGEVVRQQSNNGSIYVRIDNGYELDELHNVYINTSSLAYGDLLMRSSSVWINTKQLSGSYGLTGSLNANSFTGSLFGTASYASSTVTPFRIATGSISASVSTETNIFLITSGSSTFFNIDNQGSTTISSSASNIFLIRNQNNTPVLTVSQSGVVIFATQSQEPAGTAVPGAFYFTSSSLFIGVE